MSGALVANQQGSRSPSSMARTRALRRMRPFITLETNINSFKLLCCGMDWSIGVRKRSREVEESKKGKGRVMNSDKVIKC